MKDIRIEKGELLEILTENRKNHRAIFEEAVEGYRQRAVEILTEQLDRIAQGRLERVNVQIPLPSDHTQDYDRAIKMLEMTLDDEIYVDEADFQGYVMDEWGWKKEFLTSNSSYSTTARTLLERQVTSG